ncbi:MAG: sel1 repeat family protein, partial [Helicobacteraceae bacterium]|nr:sel1 repeat family protein [Helicobacteraceae bacterium]
ILFLAFASLAYAESVYVLEQKAKSGDLDAARELGEFYLEEGERQKAFQWFKRCYELGDKRCARGLGVIYEMFDRDYPNAIKWYEIAYKMKDDEAAYSLATLYEDRHKDYPKALKWYEIAYKEGDKDAAYALGLLYDDILKDYENAKKWYEIAHKGGYKDAAYALGILYGNILKDYPKAIEWYTIAYNQGDYKGIQATSVLYYSRYKDKITAGAYNLGLIGKYSKEDVINNLKSDWNFTTDELKQAYKLHQTLDLPSRYRYKGGVD